MPRGQVPLRKPNVEYRGFKNGKCNKDSAICRTESFHCIFPQVPRVLGRLYEHVRWRRPRKVTLYEMAVSPFSDLTGCPPFHPLSRSGKERLFTFCHQCRGFRSGDLLAHFLPHGKAAPVTRHDSYHRGITLECKFYKIK